MGSFVIETPTRLVLPPELPQALLATMLSYRDKRAEFDLKRIKDRPSWHIQQLGEEGYQEVLQALMDKAKGSLLFTGEDGTRWTYTGLLGMLHEHFPDYEIVNHVRYPAPHPLPWIKKPHPLRPYQIEASDLLLGDTDQHYPRSVEMGTGLGKSRIIVELERTHGLRAVVMAPSTSIAGQLLSQATAALGAKNVGAYFDGKKQLGRLITVGTAQSFTKVERGTPAWAHLSGAQVFIADESHMCPADTLASVCLGEYVNKKWVAGLCAGAPYRYFFSGTQIRGDGLDLVLKGIIGDPLYVMSVRDGVEGQWLAKPHFVMVNVTSESGVYSKDPNRMTREHLYRNPQINRFAGQTASRFAAAGKFVLILVDELTQVQHLLPHLTVEYGLAHGGVTKDNKESLPPGLHKSNPDALVGRFNAGQLPCLIGTSCIGTGTDVKPPGQMVVLNLVGGRSETQLRQAVGRGTRREGKDHFLFMDFDVNNVESLHRHANDRRAIYTQIYEPAREMSPS